MHNKEVMKQALDALESYQVLSCVGGGAYDPECANDKVCEAVEHLRAAIAQGESESVGQVRQKQGYADGSFFVRWSKLVKPGDLLYAAPQVADYVPLSDGQIYTAYIEASNQTLRPQDERIAIAFARAIERAVRGDAQ